MLRGYRVCLLPGAVGLVVVLAVGAAAVALLATAGLLRGRLASLLPLLWRFLCSSPRTVSLQRCLFRVCSSHHIKIFSYSGVFVAQPTTR